MDKQLLIYSSVKALSKTDHKGWSLKAQDNLNFAKEINSVPVTAIEVGLLAASLPIVFTQGDVPGLVAVMGMTEGQNLMINDEGKWEARYIPAFLRRYPFVFAKAPESDSFTVCIDEDFEGWNSKSRGERLFDGDGEQTQYLQNIVAFLQDYQAQFDRTQAFCKRLVELDLLEDIQANFDLADGSKVQLGGFRGINRAKFKALPDDEVVGMFRRDELDLIYLHLQSLSRFQSLAEKFAERKSTEIVEEGETKH